MTRAEMEGEILRLQAVIGAASELWDLCQGNVKPSKASNALGVLLDDAHVMADSLLNGLARLEQEIALRETGRIYSNLARIDAELEQEK